MKPFECSPLEGRPSTTSPGSIASPVRTSSRGTTPIAAPTRSIPCGDGVALEHLWHLGELAAGDLDPGPLGAHPEALADLGQDALVDLLNGDVVDHRDRLGPHADQVVHVHRHAVDADRVEPLRLLGDDQLGAHSVGADRDRRVVVERQHACVVTGAKDRAPRPAGVDPSQRGDQRPDAGRGGVRVHARARIRAPRFRHRAGPRHSAIAPSAAR